MMLHAPVPAPINGRSTAIRVLRWTFKKGDQSLTCLVQRAASSFDVWVIPHWDVASAMVEQTETPVRAFCRHAEVAMRLRSAGWCVVARSR